VSGPRRTFAAVAAYGVALVVAGVLVLAAPGGGAAASAPAPARTVSAAPVLAPAATPSSTATASGSATGPVVVAAEGVDAAARTAFVPTTLTLWNGQSAPVVRADVRSDDSLVVPDDPAVVGWWTGGSQAGEAFGHVVVAGHIDSARLGIGILAQLARARTGQVVTLAAGAEQARYRVASVREVKKADLAKDPTIFAQDAGHRLVLITCGGRFDPVTHRYDDNLVVEAVPV
jgi:LPXTG-site transpeptidase (sortase) family protein